MLNGGYSIGERKRNKKKAATVGSTSEASASGERDSPAHSGGTSSSSGPGTEVSLEDFMDAIGSAAPEEALEMCFPDGSLDQSSWAASLTVASPLGGEFAGGVQMPGFLLADSPDTEAAGGVSLAGDGQAEALSGAFQTGGIDPSSLSVTARDTSSPTDSAPSADSYLLPMNELTVLRAILRISQRLNVSSFWSLDAASPFTTGAAAPLSLPAPWRPTPSQLAMQHHPIIDFMPWPGVRDRLLGVMAMPDELRPEGAAGPLALVNFAYDVEDSSEGMRIWGDDIFDPSCWEVGQVLFEKWWFLFDREIIENSNRWRRARGANTLTTREAGGGGSAG